MLYCQSLHQHTSQPTEHTQIAASLLHNNSIFFGEKKILIFCTTFWFQYCMHDIIC